MMHEYRIGIDEVGRGPLAGPVTIGLVETPGNFDWESKLPGVTDSKKLTSEKRAAILKTAKELRYRRELNFTVASVSASIIDNIGISSAIKIAIKRCIDRLKLDPEVCSIRLDGSLYAPAEFTQATIIKGDALYPEIGLASIVAKESRDAYMRRISKRFPYYDFHTHKGYGTKAHRAAIQKHGICLLHRQSYCKNILSL